MPVEPDDPFGGAIPERDFHVVGASGHFDDGPRPARRDDVPAVLAGRTHLHDGGAVRVGAIAHGYLEVGVGGHRAWHGDATEHSGDHGRAYQASDFGWVSPLPAPLFRLHTTPGARASDAARCGPSTDDCCRGGVPSISDASVQRPPPAIAPV